MRRPWGPTFNGGQLRPPWRRLPYGRQRVPRGVPAFPQKVEVRKEFLAAETDSQPETRMLRAEAVLIVSRQPLTNRKLAQLAGLADATEARTLIRQLNDRYDRSGRAVRIEQVAGGYVLLTRPQLAPWLRRLQYLPGAIRLTPPVLETLAIVAYRQPVLRVDIEAIRGAACGEILRQLMQKDLIRISGRSEELGRPFLYSTTHRFLQTFGLQNTESLPHADWFQSVAENLEQNDDLTTEISEIPDSDDKECKVSIRLAAALQENDFVDELATDYSVAEASHAFSGAPVAVEEDDDFEEEDDYEDDEDEDEEDVEEFEDEDEEFEDEEEEFDEDEWEEVEGEEDEEEEDDEEGDWEEEEYEEEDDEFEEDEVDGDGEEEEEDEEEWD